MYRNEASTLLHGGPEGVAEWNRRRLQGEEIPNLSSIVLRGANLRGANLSGANLSDSRLNGANLSGANLSRADLSRADLGSANLNSTDLSSANLSSAELDNVTLENASAFRANFQEADFGNANLANANLSGANLNGANLSGADLNSAMVSSTTFVNLSLSEVKSLDQVSHLGPSSLGVDTLTKSNGKIPDDFLRGCGFSLWEVAIAKLYNPDLTANEVSNLVSVDLFSKRTVGPLYLGGVFISYSHTQKGIADKLRERLHEAGASVWLDRHDAVSGDLNKQIQREIRLRDVVVLILSESSVNSDWVEHELKSARKKEKEENRDVLCPIAVDDSWKAKMDNPNWSHLSDKLILDFSSWKTKAFGGQFEKLLKGLKINYENRK